MSALGLVVNVIVLWNTIYIDAALGQLRQEGLQCTPSPLILSSWAAVWLKLALFTFPIDNLPTGR